MSKKANALLLELLASRIDAAGVHCVSTPPGDGDPDNGDGDGDEPPCDPDDPNKPDPAIRARCYA